MVAMDTNYWTTEVRTARAVISDWRDQHGQAAVCARLGDIPASLLRGICSEKLAPIGRKYARRASRESGIPYIAVRNLDEPIGKLVAEQIEADRVARDAAGGF